MYDTGCLLSRCLVAALIALGVSHGAEYHVTSSGNDGNPGTKGKPWRTLSKAAAEAKAGDVVTIWDGVYRDGVKPSNMGTKEKPITFKAAKGARVVISGAEEVKGWAKHSGNIYKAKIESSLGKNNQVFFDGKPLQEARWPNDKDGDPMTVDGAKIEGGSVARIVSSKLPSVSGVKGAVIWALADRAWSSWTSIITNYQPAKKTVGFQSYKGNWWVEQRHNPAKKKGYFYMVGALSLLDAPGEWFVDETTKTLYLYAPKGEDPNRHAVAIQVRKVGIDLSGCSWVVVDGVELSGATADLSSAKHCVLRRVKAKHIYHMRGGRTSNSLWGEKDGIRLSGHHNVIRDCEIAYSAGSGIHLRGADNAIINCWIHHIDYIGAYCAPIAMGGMRHLISHNTISVTGRDCIKLGGAEHLIQYNDISYPGRICHDLGMIYSGGQDGGNTRIHHNWVHGNPGSAGRNVGIYLDNYMKNYIVDHNIVWDAANAIRLNRPTMFCMVLNNIVSTDINNVWGPWKGQKIQWGCHVMNNVTVKRIKMNPEVATLSNVTGQKFAAHFDTRKRRLTGKLVGKARAVRGITGNVPCVGAFDSGAGWRAGHDFAKPPTPSYAPVKIPLCNHIKNAAFEYDRYYKEAEIPIDSSPVEWEKVGAATAAVKYHKGFNTPTAQARNSIHAMSLSLSGNGPDGVKQKITGLLPNTSYYFSGYTRHDKGSNVEFKVVQAGGAKKVDSKSIRLGKGQNWRLVVVKFTSAADGVATVHITKTGAGTAYVDNTGVVMAKFIDSK